MLLLNLLLALAWMALTGQFDPFNFFVGFVIGYLLLRLLRPPEASLAYFGRGWLILRFVLFYLKELFQANLRMAMAVLSPKLNFTPAVVAIPLESRSDLAVTLLSNLITLTPGSLTLDISSDCSVLYVHTMHADDIDQFRSQIKSLESRVLEVTQ